MDSTGVWRVSAMSGAMALTRTPSRPSSTARLRVKAFTAALKAE
jgi:hypothetical protein